MAKRILSAVIGGPLLLFLTWLGGWYLAVMITVIALLGVREYLNLGQKAGMKAISSGLTWLFCIVWLIVFLFQQSAWLLPLGMIWFIIIFGLYAVRYSAITFAEAAFGFLIVVYPLALFALLFFLRQLPHGVYWCFFVFLAVWITDSGAFFVGNSFGKRKLAPNVSPNKSIEGAVGGLVAACLFGLVFWLITKEGSLPSVLILSLVTGIVSQVGDLFESALKRNAGIKDSGNFIPGHGGILDRFDSFLFALPLVYFSLILGLVG